MSTWQSSRTYRGRARHSFHANQNRLTNPQFKYIVPSVGAERQEQTLTPAGSQTRCGAGSGDERSNPYGAVKKRQRSGFVPAIRHPVETGAPGRERICCCCRRHERWSRCLAGKREVRSKTPVEVKWNVSGASELMQPIFVGNPLCP